MIERIGKLATEDAMSFDPYIHFQGNCAAAMTAYAEIFAADDLRLMRYAQMSDAPPHLANSNLVMHATLTVGDRVLMGSDFPPDVAGDPQKAVSISHYEPDNAKAKAIFDSLSEGGEEIMAWGETFWAEGFGMVKDRFGTHWMINGAGKEIGG